MSDVKYVYAALVILYTIVFNTLVYVLNSRQLTTRIFGSKSSISNGATYVLAFRSCALFAFAFVIAFQGLAPPGLATGLHDSFLPYFTNWTFVGYGIYALLGIALSVRGIRSTRYGKLEAWTSGGAGQYGQAYDWLDKAFAATLTTVASSSVFLSAFYWAVLYTGGTVLLENLFKHGGTVFLFILEYMLSRAPVATSWFLFPSLYVSIYAVYMWINWAAEHWWVYAVLDWREADGLAYNLVMPFLGLGGFYFLYDAPSCGLASPEDIASLANFDGLES